MVNTAGYLASRLGLESKLSGFSPAWVCVSPFGNETALPLTTENQGTTAVTGLYVFMHVRCNREDLKQQSLLSKCALLLLASLRSVHVRRREFNSFLCWFFFFLI